MSIRDLIRQSGYKQYWVAERIGLTEQGFSRMMTGRDPFPDDKKLPLARLLGITRREVECLLAEIPRSGAAP
jgi:plasmid maintenance system antidote protein VapI